MTCSMNSSWMARRAGSVFSTSRMGRMFSMQLRANSFPRSFCMWPVASLLPAYTTGRLYMVPSLGLGSAAFNSSAMLTTWLMVPPSVPPAMSIMSGLRFLICWIFLWGGFLSFVAKTSITMAPAPRAALLALSPVILLITPVTIIWRPPPALLVVQ